MERTFPSLIQDLFLRNRMGCCTPPRAKPLLIEVLAFDTVRGLNSREDLTTLHLVNQARHSKLPLAYLFSKPRRDASYVQSVLMRAVENLRYIKSRMC